jgi:hypothetical protein
MDTIDGYIGNLWGIIEDDGTWTYYVNPQKLSRRSDPVWFFIYPPFTLGAEEVILSRSVDWNAVVYDGTISQHPVITGIDLGSHNFSAVTVSCSGGNLTVDGAPPYMAQITVMRVVDGREGVMWIETSDRVTGRQNPLNMGAFTFDAAFPFRPGTILRLQFRLLRNSYSSTEERLYNLDFDPQAVLANPVITWPDIDIAF